MILGAWWVAAAGAGTLAGVVRDEAGAPVAGATVTVLDPRLAWAETTTDTAGAWEIGGLPPNPYRVRAVPPADANVVEGYAPSVASLCDGTVFAVPDDGRVDGADVTLAAGGTIVGRLLDAGGQPVVGASVATETTGGETSPRVAVSGDDGSFVLAGVPATDGDVRLEIDTPDHPDQYVGATTIPELALLANVQPGEVLDVGDQRLLTGITVGGRVHGPDGQPVTSGSVTAYSPSQLRTVSIAADGTWEVRGLPSGDVLAWAEVEGLATTYWPDHDRPVDRLSVPAEGEVRLDMDLFLPREATLTGRLAGDVDWSGASVLLYNSDRTVGFADLVDPDGTFAVTAIHGGAYTVFVNAEEQGYVADFLREGGDEAVLTVPHEGVLDLGEVTVPPGSAIEGVVEHAGTGEPVFGATVYAGSETSPDVELGVVEADGSYRIGGLPAGPWRLWVTYSAACPGDPAFVELHHPDEPNPAFATPIDLGVGDTHTWDVALPPDDDHDGMDDLWEEEHALDPTRDDGGEDPDDDGYTNLEEYLLGTDPHDGRQGCGCGSGRSAGGALGLLALVARYRRRVSSVDVSLDAPRLSAASRAARDGHRHGG